MQPYKPQPLQETFHVRSRAWKKKYECKKNKGEHEWGEIEWDEKWHSWWLSRFKRDAEEHRYGKSHCIHCNKKRMSWQYRDRVTKVINRTDHW